MVTRAVASATPAINAYHRAHRPWVRSWTLRTRKSRTGPNPAGLIKAWNLLSSLSGMHSQPERLPVPEQDAVGRHGAKAGNKHISFSPI